MEKKITLKPFQRVLSGYETLSKTALSISDCSELAEKYKQFGVDGYRIGDYSGPSYLNRYLDCSIKSAPMLVYKRDVFIPMVFRSANESQKLFSEPSRMPGFFVLLDWLIENRPEKAIISYRAPTEFSSGKMYVDSAYVAFRLSEILDGGGFPISRFKNLEEFVVWNRIYRLIESGQIGRHSRIFDVDNPTNVSELRMILQVVQLKYPETTFFI
ncbi:hypothetical protein C7K38_08900 [Tetragenococcus osmophilus]|uniref:Uncharacterized protein n=1 Tax=Tetragenococcus osmophilus TaxID=526944 RepID=A0AA37XJS5_9ENTE|nr:hypothetical protein [Tetragenococcus osmophilus]AYW48469.1 hypothetical protein C7K38_08900 [Tetragenococcus osmophilus]GMA71797.1 hypothetical protein GCM10025885_08460 [Tetragenococcus osmophilus]